MLLPPIAAGQHGVFSRRQARAAGMSSKVIASRVHSGLWREVLPHAFALAAAADSVQVRAQAAALVTPGVLSHETAAILHGLPLTWEPDRDVVHVTLRPRVHDLLPGVVVHRLPLSADECVELGAMSVTSRLRTAVDLLAWAPAPDARSLLFRLVQEDLVDARSLRGETARRKGRHGTPRLRALADLLDTGAHSVAERKLHQLLRTVDGLTWTPNAPLTVNARRFFADVLVPDHRLVIEIDGRRFHGGAAFERDRERQNLIVGAGYTVLRFTWLDLVERPDYVVATVLAQLRR